MATTALGSVLSYLRRSGLHQEEVGHTDGDLLERFVTGDDEATFEALLRRHGPMVLGVCRRVLRNEADAEDAFQATFLVLVRKADSLRPHGLVGNWLYGVAHNTALKAREMNLRRRQKEQEAGALPGRSEPGGMWAELLALLDRELPALPDKYRAPIVLCDLEGKTIREASRQLGWPQGTVGTRLSRGRELLARRLAPAGLPLSGAALALARALARQSAPAGVRTARIGSTVLAALSAAAGGAAGVVSPTVAAVTQQVVNAMLTTRRKA